LFVTNYVHPDRLHIDWIYKPASLRSCAGCQNNAVILTFTIIFGSEKLHCEAIFAARYQINHSSVQILGEIHIEADQSIIYLCVLTGVDLRQYFLRLPLEVWPRKNTQQIGSDMPFMCQWNKDKQFSALEHAVYTIKHGFLHIGAHAQPLVGVLFVCSLLFEMREPPV
jgi:hypothetical protein